MVRRENVENCVRGFVPHRPETSANLKRIVSYFLNLAWYAYGLYISHIDKVEAEKNRRLLDIIYHLCYRFVPLQSLVLRSCLICFNMVTSRR